MLLTIPDVLSPAQVARALEVLNAADWVDGKVTAGHQSAQRQIPGTSHRIRTDISATLFFAHPDEYDGGELIVEDTFGIHSVKLPSGHLVIYPASSLHHVKPVTRGARIASFFWIQSMIRDDSQRTLLFDLDTATQHVSQTTSDSSSSVRLTGVYHNLLRRWVDA
jgi:PKHD-type hydroxylase